MYTLYMYVVCVSGGLSVCLFMLNKRQNDFTDRAQICMGPQMNPKKVYE